MVTLAERVGEILDRTAAAVLWQYASEEGTFYLPTKVVSVHSPWSGKMLKLKPARLNMSDLGRELKDSSDPEEKEPDAKTASDVVVDDDFWKASSEDIELPKTASAALWKYVDGEGQVFYLESRTTGTLHSPYSGKSLTGKPDKETVSDVGKELKDKTASEAVLIMREGSEHPAAQALKKAYDQAMAAFATVGQKTASTKTASSRVLDEVKPAVENLAKVAAIVAKQLETKLG